jgi:hypothetical protein
MRRTRSHLLSEDMEGSYQEMMEILDEGPGTKVASEVMPDGISQPNLMDYALEQKGIRWNDKGMEQCPFLLPYILADLLYDLDLRVFPGGGSMIELGRVSLNVSHLRGWYRQPYCRKSSTTLRQPRDITASRVCQGLSVHHSADRAGPHRS